MHRITREEYRQARDLIATPGRWCSEEFAVGGYPWSWADVIDDPTAQFCAVGAIYAVCRDRFHDIGVDDYALNQASNDLFGVGIIDLNDDEGLDKVLQAYDHLLVNWDYYNEAK